MLIWNLLFLSKIALWWFNRLEFIPILNIGLFAAIVTTHSLVKHKTLRYISLGLIMPSLSTALIAYEVNEITRLALLLYADNLFNYSFAFIQELFNRAFTPNILWSALALTIALHLLGRYIRLTAWMSLIILIISTQIALSDQPIHDTLPSQTAHTAPTDNLYTLVKSKLEAEKIALQSTQFDALKQIIRNRLTPTPTLDLTPDEKLNHFYAQQQAITLKELNQTTQQTQPNTQPQQQFDLIFLHLTGLSWAELQLYKQSSHPVFANADLLMTQFNTVASHSQSALSRLAFSNCGQAPNSIPPTSTENIQKCNLFTQLKLAGFQLQYGLNHEGTADGLKTQIQQLMGKKALEPIRAIDLPIGLIGYDNSEITQDIDFLAAWWDNRIKVKTHPVVLYYHSITLHDGNRLFDETNNHSSGHDSASSYPKRLETLLTDLNDFINTIRESQRAALIFIIPTHGAGLSGAYNQPKRIHEIPTPAITLVPVAIHWISPNYQKQAIYDFPIKIQEPTSYLAVSRFIHQWLHLPSPTHHNPAWPVLFADLPSTPFVSQENNLTLIQHQNTYLLQRANQPWTTLNPNPN